jgi:chemotaxis protein CheD
VEVTAVLRRRLRRLDGQTVAGRILRDPRSHEVLVTVLGSCVAACIRDPVARVGGMNHFMLVGCSAGTGDWGVVPESARYGNFAMEKLINHLLKRGCMRERMDVKVFGSANVTHTRNAVGTDNSEFVLRYLKAEGLACTAADLGGIEARRVLYYRSIGRVVRRLLTGRDQEAVLSEEAGYAIALGGVRSLAEAELFR